MLSSRGTVRYEERGQGYRDVEKDGKHWFRHYKLYVKSLLSATTHNLYRVSQKYLYLL